MFTLLQEGTFTLTKPEDLDAVRSAYVDMSKTLRDTRDAFPTTWPQTLPNLGTHDTQPSVPSHFALYCFDLIFSPLFLQIAVRSLSDFKVVMVAYNDYLEALLSLADRWVPLTFFDSPSLSFPPLEHYSAIVI